MTKQESIVKMVRALVNDPKLTTKQFNAGLKKLKEAVEKETITRG